MSSKLKKEYISPNKISRYLLFFAGTLFLGLGLIGIVLPILPTTPFLLLTAACYARSSKRFYEWLINNKLFGKYIKNYRENNGIPLKGKILAISLLWTTIIFSTLFFINEFFISLFLVIIASFVTIYLIKIKTFKQKNIQ